MPNLVVLNQEGKELHEITLCPEVFGIEPNQQCIFDAIIMQRASRHQGTHDTKGRSEVRGGGRKPWRQKGTGRARQGSIRAAQWRGGGTVFGPTPRSYSYRLNKKVRRLAIKSVLTEKVLSDDMIVVDTFKLETAKTKDFIKVIDAIKATKKTLFVVSEEEDFGNAFLSMRNIPSMMMLTADAINVYDVVNANKIVFTENALKNVEEALGNE
ncbi:MAG: 50S ribosomal protein L4 [Erysipelotrichaceae bacterium]